MNLCRETNNARRLAAEMNMPYIPCENKGFFCKLKYYTCSLYGAIMNSWKLKFLIIFSLILVIINAALIYFGHYNVSSDEKGVPTNAIYLSTTQLTTIGYGDITPTTYIAKWFSSFVHLVILVISLNLAEEFGAVTVARQNQTNHIKKEMKKEIGPIKAKLEISDELIKEVDNVVRMGFPKGITTVSDIMSANMKRNSTIDTIDKARNKFKELIKKDE